VQTTLCSTIDVTYPTPGEYYITVTGKASTDEGVFGLRWDTFLGEMPSFSPLPSFTPAASLSPVHSYHGYPVSSGADAQAPDVAQGVAFVAVGAAVAVANGVAGRH
jgi:hypothetical protein